MSAESLAWIDQNTTLLVAGMLCFLYIANADSSLV